MLSNPFDWLEPEGGVHVESLGIHSFLNCYSNIKDVSTNGISLTSVVFAIEFIFKVKPFQQGHETRRLKSLVIHSSIQINVIIQESA